MALQHHTRNLGGQFRRERADSKVQNLKKEYPALANVNGNMKLGTLRDRLGVSSLDGVLKALRKEAR